MDDPPMDELLAEIAESGWLFNNCYQVDATLWRVNLRRPDGNGDWFTDWAMGPTFADALHDCMAKLAEAEWIEEHPVTFAKAADPAPTSGKSLLSRLGLGQRPKVERRI